MTGDLLTLLRAHDLPPRWDGHAVWWEGWEPQIDAWICGPGAPARRDRCCPGCGSYARPAVNRGHVCNPTTVSVEKWRERCEAWARLPYGERHRLPKHPSGHVSLHAVRCPDCSLDCVLDTETGDCWTLDHTDYGDNGSEAP